MPIQGSRQFQQKQKGRVFGPAFVYENKVLNLCVSGAAPQTYAKFHTHGTLHFTPSTRKAYPIPGYVPVTSTGDRPGRTFILHCRQVARATG